MDRSAMANLAARLVTAGAVMLAAAPRAFAQGCAMCYTEAAAQGPRARHALDFAILVLLIPAVSMFAGIFFALRRRDRHLAPVEQAAARSTFSVSSWLVPRSRA